MQRRSALAPTNRNVSASTGLAKFHLSPKRENVNEDRKAVSQEAVPFELSQKSLSGSGRIPSQPARRAQASPFSGFAVDKPSKETQQPQFSRNELLSRYALKQTKLMELEKQKEILEFEILEIQAQLKTSIQVENHGAARPKNGLELTDLKKKVSTLFMPPPPTVRKAPSSIFTPSPELKKMTSAIFSPLEKPISIPQSELSRKASLVFSEVKSKFDQQQNEIEALTKKSATLAKSFVNRWSPTKKSSTAATDTSFSLDNWTLSPALANESILLSEDEPFDESGIHIDDYESD